MLWLWRRPVATAPIQPLAWEPPYAVDVALKRWKKKKKKEINSNYVSSEVFCWKVLSAMEKENRGGQGSVGELEKSQVTSFSISVVLFVFLLQEMGN